MGLSTTERASITKARASGTSELAVPITDAMCKYLIAVIVRDLGYDKSFPELPKKVPDFFSTEAIEHPPEIRGYFATLMDRLVEVDRDTVTYFCCLIALYKGRLKYHRILQCQPLPTVEQVGPRGLLQFGTMSTQALAALLFWRKWLYDLDNRAAQETGYVFEPLIAASVGGAPIPAAKSPIKRRRDGSKGRQVDCIVDKLAYEIKMRVTIAASGQGRWGEELDFPADARASGYTPVLIVFDGTENPKLRDLKAAFLREGGQVHIGVDAWAHLDQMAGKTMATFLERYVRVPIQELLDDAPSAGSLPRITFSLTEEKFVVDVDGETWEIGRESAAKQRELFDED
jgi:hypothetical protein